MKSTHGVQNLNGEAVALFEFEFRTQQRREEEGSRGEEGRGREGRGGQRDTEAHRETDTDRDKQRHTDRKRERQRERQRDRQGEGHTDREANRETDRGKERKRDRAKGCDPRPNDWTRGVFDEIHITLFWYITPSSSVTLSTLYAASTYINVTLM